MSSYVKELHFKQKLARTDATKAEAAEKRKALHKKNSKLVKGRFKNLEAPGGDLTFSFREFKEDPIRTYYFKDGETYEVPLGVAKHINNNTKTPIHSHIIDKDGRRMTAPGQYRERYQFISTDYE